jgi:predicted ATP-grasp superfamily ATP-dependent carboligase
MFADLDLRACASVLESVDYPDGLITAAAAVSCRPWIYTGGLENHPALIREISKTHVLWGNDPPVLAKIRNPWRVAGVLAEAGLPALRVVPREESPPPADGTWMQKPLRGAAGRGIEIWNQDCNLRPTLREAHYFQELRAGIPISALFVAAPGRTLLIGVTQQMVGLAAIHAPQFAWCGTITPVTVAPEIRELIERIASALASWAGLRGLFGCDFLVDETGLPWLTEVNPRYPASTELLENHLGIPLLDWHRRACEAFEGSTVRNLMLDPPRAVVSGVVGKIILYAGSDLVAPDLNRFLADPGSRSRPDGRNAWALPFLADIPLPGTRIPAGQPVCTLFARAADAETCLAKLLRRAAKMELRFR